MAELRSPLDATPCTVIPLEPGAKRLGVTVPCKVRVRLPLPAFIEDDGEKLHPPPVSEGWPGVERPTVSMKPFMGERVTVKLAKSP